MCVCVFVQAGVCTSVCLDTGKGVCGWWEMLSCWCWLLGVVILALRCAFRGDRHQRQPVDASLANVCSADAFSDVNVCLVYRPKRADRVYYAHTSFTRLHRSGDVGGPKAAVPWAYCEYAGTTIVAVDARQTIVALAEDGHRVNVIWHPPFVRVWIRGYCANPLHKGTARDPKTARLYVYNDRTIVCLDVRLRVWAIASFVHTISKLWVTRYDTLAVLDATEDKKCVQLVSLRTSRVVGEWTNVASDMIDHALACDETLVFPASRGSQDIGGSRYHWDFPAFAIRATQNVYTRELVPESHVSTECTQRFIYGGRFLVPCKLDGYLAFRAFQRASATYSEETRELYVPEGSLHQPGDNKYWDDFREGGALHQLMTRPRTVRYNAYVMDTHVLCQGRFLYAGAPAVRSFVLGANRRIKEPGWIAFVDSTTHDELSHFLHHAMRRTHSAWSVYSLSQIIVDLALHRPPHVSA